MKKVRHMVILAVILVFLMFVPFAAADTLSDKLSNIGQKIISIGQLGFLGVESGSLVVGFTRILIWILLFTIFFAASNVLKSEKEEFMFFNKNQAMVIAAVIATIAAIFLPVDVILAVGAGWGTAIALVLVGGPVVGAAYLLFKFPVQETRGIIFIKLVICLLLFWILTAMAYHVNILAGAP